MATRSGRDSRHWRFSNVESAGLRAPNGQGPLLEGIRIEQVHQIFNGVVKGSLPTFQAGKVLPDQTRDGCKRRFFPGFLALAFGLLAKF